MTVESATITDSQLMRHASATSVGAFAELYDRYCDRAYRVAFSVCRDDGRAQDAVQDAFLSVWRRRSAYSPARGTVAAWLLTVVRYRAIDLARHNARHDTHRADEDQLDMLCAPDPSLRPAACFVGDTEQAPNVGSRHESLWAG